MDFKEMINESIDSITANKSRTALLLIGLVIGIGSVITVVSIGDGSSVAIRELLGGQSATTIFIYPNYNYLSSVQWKYRIEDLTENDIRDLNTNSQYLTGVIPEAAITVNCKAGYREEKSKLIGTLPLYLEVYDLDLEDGRNINWLDHLYKRKVVVIGHTLANSLFPGDDPVGKYIHLQNGNIVEVIGLLKKQKQPMLLSFTDFDATYNNSMFAPFGTMERMGGDSTISFLQGEAIDEEHIDDAMDEILAILNYNHGLYDGKASKYQVEDMSSILKQMDTITNLLTVFISLIAAISLFVAGIGVMNIMFVTIKERTREIGIRKALGAPPYIILNQILLETIILCGSGGLLGTVVSSIAVYLIAHYSGWPAVISIKMVVISVVLALSTGIIFGAIPANRAADMDPVVALREE